MTDHHLAKKKPKPQPQDEYMLAKSTTSVQETKEEEYESLLVEDMSINRVTPAKLIMVKPADIVVMLDSTTE